MGGTVVLLLFLTSDSLDDCTNPLQYCANLANVPLNQSNKLTPHCLSTYLYKMQTPSHFL